MCTCIVRMAPVSTTFILRVINGDAMVPVVPLEANIGCQVSEAKAR